MAQGYIETFKNLNDALRIKMEDVWGVPFISAASCFISDSRKNGSGAVSRETFHVKLFLVWLKAVADTTD